MTRLRVIGVGNRFRRDDGVGLAVLDYLEAQARVAPVDGVVLSRHDGEVATLLDMLSACEHAIIVDAIKPGGDLCPGDVLQLPWDSTPLAAHPLRASSHVLGVAEALAMGEVLGCLPDSITLCGVVGGDFSHGEGLSSAVAGAADRLGHSLWRDHLCQVAVEADHA